MKVRIARVPEHAPVQTGRPGRGLSSEAVEEILSTLAVVLKCLPGPHLVDKVTVVMTSLELLITHPAILEYKHCLIDSLNNLAKVLMSDGLTSLSQKTRALSFLLIVR